MSDQARLAGGLKNCCVLDSVTHLKPDAAEAVVIAASHCGVFTARYALQFEIGAIILHDAGIGKDQAGIRGLAILGQAGIPAAAVSYRSARIGDGLDCAQRGVISHCTGLALDMGVMIDMPVCEAVRYLPSNRVPTRQAPMTEQESRHTLDIPGATRAVIITDSASLIGPGDEGTIAVTGSHGGILGNRPETAIKDDVYAALFNDAGGGADNAGISRLPALDIRGIAAATVDAWSARIGDARSTYDEGVLSHVNETAARLGAHRGMPASGFVDLAARPFQ